MRQQVYPSRVYCELLSAGTLAGTGSGQDHYFGFVYVRMCVGMDVCMRVVEKEDYGLRNRESESESLVVELSAEWIMPAIWLV